MNRNPTRKRTQELASRIADGLAVALIWHPGDDSVTVAVADARTGEDFELCVARERALDAFYHPFAYTH
jgi:hypothetical protein